MQRHLLSSAAIAFAEHTAAMFVVFIGPPGAGKGTQSERLVQHLGLEHLSTGEVLRKAVADGTPRGIQAAPFLDQGKLVPDSLVTQIVSRRLRETQASGCLLDGFPRTVVQAELLDEDLASLDAKLDVVLVLCVSDEIVTRRIVGRAEQAIANGETPRDDDDPIMTSKRLSVYHSQTEPVLDYYRRRGVLREIDGLGTIDEVFQRICDVVDPLTAT